MKVALFDVDGTILNSMGRWENMGELYLKSKGIAITNNINNILYSMSLVESASYLKNQYNLESSVQEIMEDFRNDLYFYYENEVNLKDGIVDVLKALKNDGYKLYIASLSTKELIGKSFERLEIGQYFSGIFTYDDIKVSKDDSCFYTKIAKRLKTDPNDIIVFEDNISAAKAARKSGMKVIGIYDKYSRGNIETIAHKYITHWNELFATSSEL
jgi:HAD superfamily hydrolase (TIGR01509 family)